MTGPWTSTAGIVLRDLVPAGLRRRWVADRHCADRDLYTLFREQVRAHPGRPAVVDGSGTIDYATLDGLVRGVAAALAEAGFGGHDIVAVQVPNGRHAVVAELAVAAIGAVALPLAAGRGRRDCLSLLGRSRAGAAIVAGEARGVPLAANLAGLRAELPHLRAVFVHGAAPPGCRALDPWLAGDAGRDWSPAPVAAEAPARILTTSGSEAEPKMIAYSHNAMAGGRGNYLRALHDGDGPMRNLILVPLSSSYGSCGTSVTLARHGGTVLLVEPFDAAAVLRTVAAHRPTHLFGVPTMLARLAAHAPAAGADLAGLRMVVSSGAALHPETARACRARLGVPVVDVYGSADGMNCHPARDGRADAGSGSGTPRPDVALIRIRAEDGSAWVPPGTAGEICALGPMTPLCYVNAPELDRRYRLPGGWVRSGDRGLLDRDGSLHVVGRIKQIVVRGGFNISPAELEREIGACPGVADVACVGVADADLGERLAACVVQRPGTPPLTLPALTAFLRRERGLEPRKLPELLVRLAELPLGPTGKVCRETLAGLAAAAQGRRPSTV